MVVYAALFGAWVGVAMLAIFGALDQSSLMFALGVSWVSALHFWETKA